MSNYNQFMKHWKNHRKDRFTQQCSFSTSSDDCNENNIRCNERENELKSFKMLREIPSDDYPIYIVKHGDGIWSHYDCDGFSRIRIDSQDELEQFGKDYVF